MSAFLTSLASVADQYGQAKNIAREERAATAEKAQKMDVEQAYLQLARQAEARQQAEQNYRKKAGDLIEFRDGRLWSVSQGKFIDPQQPNPMDTLRKFVGTLPADIQKGAQSRAETYLEANPQDSKGAISEVMRFADEAQRRQEQREDRATVTTESERFRTDQRKEQEDFQRGMRDEQQNFMRGMFDKREAELTPAATKIIDTTMPTLQQVDRLVDDIDRLGLGSNNQAAYLLPERLKYAIGMASPQGTLANDIAGLSLGSVIEAGSAMQGTSRSLVALRKALVHTPNPWKDSPMLMKRKLTEIRQRLQDMIDDARRYGTKGGAAAAPEVNIDQILDQTFGPAQGGASGGAATINR